MSSGLRTIPILSANQTNFCTACTDKLIQNDPAFVELSLERLGENFDLEEFLYSIRANRTVRHVCFSGTFVRELAPDQWNIMLDSIGYLEPLEELQIWCSTIPARVFANMLRRARKLHKVYFFRVSISGVQDDIQDLADALKTHPALRDIRIGGFHLIEDGCFDCVLQALAESPALEIVSLQLSTPSVAAPFTPQAIGTLVTSATLTDLYLSRLGLDAKHVTAVAESMKVNKSLRVLDLFGNNIENEHVVLFAKVLQTNKTLETLVLPCPSDDISVDACAAISRALRENTTLVTLNLPRSNLKDEGLLHLVQGLNVNTTLKKIEVGVSKDIGDQGMGALMKMLETNYELERLVVSSSQKSIKEKVQYYMRLNEVGRGALLRDGKATREQWVEMLISCSDDLDCLFYFINVNPSLCQFANASGADVIITEEFRPSRRHTIDYFGGSTLDTQKRVENRRASAF